MAGKATSKQQKPKSGVTKRKRQPQQTTSIREKRSKRSSSKPTGLLANATSTKQYQVKQCADKRFGRGVFATCAIPAHTPLFEYEGQRVRPCDIDEYDGDTRYYWICSDGVTIDGSRQGNDSRFLNHYKGTQHMSNIALLF